MKTTTNHGLKKPDGTDIVNIEDLNYNADKLDGLLVPATTTASGLMSKTDKAKLDGVAAGANNYTHPATHPASMISGLQKVATSGSYNDLLNKPSTFTPATHTHTKSQITDFPTSLPANGGNANTVGGVGVDAIAKYYRTNGSVNIADTNIKQFYGTCVTSNSSAPNTDWWHIINVPHSDNNGYGAQIALGYHGNAGLHVRSASGTTWGNWYDVIGNIESLKSSVSSGKNAIASAITAKGVSASGSDSHAVLATKIGQIDTGIRLIDGGVKSGNVSYSNSNGGIAVFHEISGTATVTIDGTTTVRISFSAAAGKNRSCISFTNSISVTGTSSCTWCVFSYNKKIVRVEYKTSTSSTVTKNGKGVVVATRGANSWPNDPKVTIDGKYTYRGGDIPIEFNTSFNIISDMISDDYSDSASYAIGYFV